jgi:hypothetical protein
MSRSQPEEIDQGSEVIDVVPDASLPRRAGAAGVATAVIEDDVEGTNECGQYGLPHSTVDPGPVHKDERVPGAGALVVELSSIDLKKGRRDTPLARDYVLHLG